MIKLLDCTLRDGGYLNNWDFGHSNIVDIVDGLSNAGTEYIECGFLEDIEYYTPEVSLFRNVADLLSIVDIKKYPNTKFCLMLNYGTPITHYDYNKDVEIRLAFKQHQLSEIENFVSNFQEKGISVSLNPMHIGLYSKEELKSLVSITNRLNPVCFTAVDTMGIVQEGDLERIFYFLDTNINKNIPLGFHSHNNLELSFKDIQVLMDMDIERDLIIDTSLNGIGRGGGMPSTDTIAQYFNNFFDKKYDLSVLAETSKYVQNITQKDKYPYYLSALYRCHPNYADYYNKKGMTYNKIESLLKNIPAKSKTLYSREIAESILRKYL